MTNRSVETIGFLIVDVARHLRRRFDQALTDAGFRLTAGEARTLAHASRHDGIRQSELAERMGVEPMTVVSFIDRLEKRGLVERAPDPSDRRAKLVRTTPAATPLLDEIETIGRLVRGEATMGLNEADVEALRQTLKHMRANLTAPEMEATGA